MILGIIDIEANYLVVKAYQYTTFTSVQVRFPVCFFMCMFSSWLVNLWKRSRIYGFVGPGLLCRWLQLHSSTYFAETEKRTFM